MAGFTFMIAGCLILIAAALFADAPIFSWYFDLSYAGYRRGWSLLPRKWTRDEYRSGMRVAMGFSGAFGLVIVVGVMVLSAGKP